MLSYRRIMGANGIVQVRGKYSVTETIDRLERQLKSQGITIFARINQAAEAEVVGLTMRPTELLIFGDPKVGTPLMNQYPSVALDLPLKVLAREADDGSTLVSYNSPQFFSERHRVPAPPFAGLSDLIRSATK